MTDAVDISSYLPELRGIWQESTGESEITVAILDGQVDLSHPCFEGADLTRLETLISRDANNTYSSQHGTNVASIIFGQHCTPIRGISPGCRGLIVPVFSDGSEGSPASCSQIDLAHAITQSLEYGANVINISGGEIEPTGKPHPLLASAVRLCAENGVLIVAAAGNDGCQCLHVPASIPSTLAVGAMDAQKLPLKFSNWGDAYQTNGILAAGEKIMVAVPGGGVATKSGTSFAASIVSGIAALLLSIQKKRGDNPDPNFVREAILQSAHSCQTSRGLDCRRYLAGSLNVAGALDHITKKYEQEIDSNDSSKQSLQSAEFSTIDSGQSKEPLKKPSQGALIALENAVSTAKMCETEMMNQNKEEEKMVETANEISDCAIEQREENKTIGSVENTCGCSDVLAQMAPSAVQAAESIEAHPNIEKAPSVMLNEVRPSQAPEPGELVYALGKIGFDFGTEARRDAFIQSMETKENQFPNPDDPIQLLKHLDKHPEYAQSMIWTLDIEGTTVYAIRPAGTFSPRAYERLREFLREQITPVPSANVAEPNTRNQEIEYLVEKVSIPGALAGQIRLLSGQVVPVINPELRGMYSWNIKDFINSVVGPAPKSEDKKAMELFASLNDDLINFLERLYYEFMNLGRASSERAMNFAGTNAFQARIVFEEASKQKLMLDRIEVERSPICRPDSDCWDVKLTFFNPMERLTVARLTFRFTIDVSDVVPVTVGKVRSWYTY